MAYLPPTVVLAELRHEAFESSVPTGSSDTGLVSKWRPKERVQAAAVFALGTVLDAGFDAAKDGVGGEEESDNDEKVRSQAAIVKNILSVVSDGSPLVRAEVAVALSRFAFSHNKHLKPQHTGLLVCVQSQQPVSWFAAYWKPQPNPILSALPPFTVKASGSGYTTPTQYMSHASIVPSTAASLHRVGETTHSVARDGRIYTSSPLAGPSVLHGSPLSDDSSQHSDTGIVADSTNNGTVNPSRPRPLDNALYSQCVLPMCTLAKDPSPRIASLGRRVLSIIGIEQVVTKSIKPSQPAELSTSTSTSLTGLARSTSWFDMNGGHLPLTFRTPPVIPLRPSYLTGMRRVYSLEFRPHVMSSPDSGLADPLLGTAAPPGPAERSFLPQSTIYNWSCGHFSKPLLTPSDDSEDSIARTEETEKLALDCIAKCQHSASRQPQNQIASWDTKFETGTKFTLLLLFSPVVIASDENERIRVWNYEEATLLNSFESHDYPDKGISKLCLVNELDEGLLLIASSDGSVRLWRDYASNGQQKLVTAFSSVQGHRPGARHIKAVVDWQQQSGCLVDVVKQKMMSGSRGSKRPSEGSDKRSPKRARGQQSVPPPRMNFEKLPMPYKTLPAPPNREKIHVIRKGELNRFEGSIRRVEFMCVQTLRKTGSVVDSLLKKSAQMNPSKMTFFVHNIIKLRTKKKAEGAEEDAEGAEEADPDIPAHTFTRSLRKRVEEDVAIQRAMPNQWSTKHLEKLKAWRQAMHFHEWSCHLRKFGMPPLPSFDMVVRLHRKFEPILSDAFYHLYMLQEQRRVDRSVYNIEGVKRSGPNLYKVDLDRTLRFSTSVIFDDTRPNLMESVAIYIDEEDNILSLDDKTYGNLVRGHLQKGETFDRSRKFNIY